MQRVSLIEANVTIVYFHCFTLYFIRNSEALRSEILSKPKIYLNGDLVKSIFLCVLMERKYCQITMFLTEFYFPLKSVRNYFLFLIKLANEMMKTL